MQRKNYILNSSRKGFAMIMAIVVIVIISTIMAMSISMTSQTTKQTTDVYLKEQAKIYAKSAVEYALFKISKENNSTQPCSFTGANFTQDDIYDINISVSYIYTNFSAVCGDPNIEYRALKTTPEENGSVLLDITVSIPTDRNLSTEPIRYFRRSIQKL